VGLSSQTMADKGGEIYCKACYAKNFGPKGYGYGGGLKDTGLNKPVDASSSDGKTHTLGSAGAGKFCGDCGAALGATLKFCPECGKQMAAAAPLPSPTSSSSSSTEHSSSSEDSSGSSSSPGSSSAEARPSSVTKSKPSLERPSSVERSSSPPKETTATTVTGNTAAKKVVIGAENPKCPACGKSVYHAEKIIGAGQTWHQDCFKCSVCRNRFVNSGEASDKDGKLYCRACYAKNFGPKGYGYGGGSATTFAHTQ